MIAAPTLADLAAKIEAVKRASMLAKPAMAEAALDGFMQYLAVQDARIKALEKGAGDANKVQS